MVGRNGEKEGGNLDEGRTENKKEGKEKGKTRDWSKREKKKMGRRKLLCRKK